MADPVIDGSRDLIAWTVTVKRGTARSFLEKVVTHAEQGGAEVLVVRADMVFGADHLRSALYHARRAIAEGRNSSDSLAMETLLYASGERQLGTAIRKMSVDEDTDEIVVAKLSSGVLVADQSWKVLPEDAGASEQMGMRFGITPDEIATLGSRGIQSLVLEKVAAIDILKK